MRCAVIGAGAWGTALADLLASNGHDTMIWAYEPDVVETINACQENRFLRGARLSTALRASTELRTVLDEAEFVLYATPSHHLRRIAKEGAGSVRRDAVIAV